MKLWSCLLGLLVLTSTAVFATEQEIQSRLQPVWKENVADASATTSATAPTSTTNPAAEPAPNDIATLYTSACATCHATGVANAPKFGDTEAWEKRFKDTGKTDAAEQMTQLVSSVTNGKGAMPPKGMCNTCTADEYVALINYMKNGGDKKAQ